MKCENCGSENRPVVIDYGFHHDWAGGGYEKREEAACPDCEFPAPVSVWDLRREQEEEWADREFDSRRDMEIEDDSEWQAQSARTSHSYGS